MSDDAVIDAAGLVSSFIPVPTRLLLGGHTAAQDAPVALLWLDIVGSTRLAEKFAASGPAGAERFGAFLQSHFDLVLRSIILNGGEPITFVGDGLLVSWRGTREDQPSHVMRAAACALELLAVENKAFPDDEPIQLHAALALGACHTVEVGEGINKRFITTGPGLADLQDTTRKRAPGRLLISHNAQEALGDLALLASERDGIVTLRGMKRILEPRKLHVPLLPSAEYEQYLVHIPPQITRQLHRQQLTWSSELRRVTVVFGSFPGLDQTAPDIIRQLDEVTTVFAPLARRHEGFVHQFWTDEQGTNLLVAFGIPPFALRDDAARAVHFTLDLRDALRSMGQRYSFGISTGLVCCSLIGNNALRSWAMFGETNSIAARLKSMRSDSIQCDEPTVYAARDSFAFAPLGGGAMRGFGTTVSVWTPLRRERRELVRPMYGRTEELKLLRAGLEVAIEGKTNLATIEAPSGLGKSRLLAELHQHAAEIGLQAMAGAGSQIENRKAFLAWGGVITRLLNIQDGLPEEVNINAALKALGEEFTPQAALLNAFLPLDLPETAMLATIPPTARGALRIGLIVALLKRSVLMGTKLITFDDAQWMDEESWRLLSVVLSEVPGLYVVLALQPLSDETRERSLTHMANRRILLTDLTAQEQESLAVKTLAAERLTPELSELLRTRVRGQPFLCIELAQALQEQGFINVVDGIGHIAPGLDPSRLPIPQTVQAALLRRIDSLQPDSQLTLKVASAAGSRFPSQLIRDVHPTRADEEGVVEHHLMQHHRNDLLIEEYMPEGIGYSFRHNLMRDITYSLMLYAQRQQLHLSIGNWYEKRFAPDPSRFYMLLAYHFEAAGEMVRAAEYQRLEAARLFSLGLVRQSVEVGLHAIRLLGGTLPTEKAALHQAIGREMQSIAVLLEERDPKALMDLPPIDMALPVARLIPLLLNISPYAYQNQQLELFALLGAMALRLTLEHGQGPFTPDVYSIYSVVHAALLGDHAAAAAWSSLSLDAQGAQRGDSFSRCAFVHVWFHAHWSDGLAEAIKLSEAGAEAGLSSGEVIFGCFNLTAKAVLCAAAGKPIDTIIETAAEMRAQHAGRAPNSAFTALLEEQAGRALAGCTQALDSLSDDKIDENTEFSVMYDAGFSNQIACYYVTKLRLSVHAGAWRKALIWAEKARALLPFFAGQPSEVLLTQFHGIAALAAAFFEPGGDGADLQSEGWSRVEQLRSWETLNCSWITPKADMLEGLLAAMAGRTDQAERLLQKSAAGAAAQGHLEDVTLAFEYLARIKRLNNADSVAEEQALAACDAWGATAKRRQMAMSFGNAQ